MGSMDTAELQIDCDEDKVLRALLVGMLRGMTEKPRRYQMTA